MVHWMKIKQMGLEQFKNLIWSVFSTKPVDTSNCFNNHKTWISGCFAKTKSVLFGIVIKIWEDTKSTH
jgi:hypothetical protein